MTVAPPLRVPFADLAALARECRPELDAAYERVITSGWYLLGKELQAFEEEYATSVAARFCAGVASGLDALILGLRALGVKSGDEVIVPANTYVASWLAVSAVGATIVPVEPDALTYNIDPELTRAAISSSTKALLPVHLYGQPAEMKPLLELAREHHLKVVVDAAQAHGAAYRGGKLGAMGDIVAWSFYPTKNLGAFGDAGAVTSNDPELIERVKVLRNYGSRVRYVNEELGMNSRLDELQAAFLRAKLPRLPSWRSRRAAQASRYIEGLRSVPLQLPFEQPQYEHGWHQFVVRSRKRDALRLHLEQRGIQTIVHYPIPPHRQRAYHFLRLDEGAFPITERLHREVLSLPLGIHLSDAQIDLVIGEIREFFDDRDRSETLMNRIGDS